MNGVTHTYTLDGTKILKEAWGGNTLVPLYDNEDSVCGVIYNGEPFYFFKNLQGDILAIADKNAQVVAKYSYDAWGVCTVEQDTSTAGIASVNPFRYRGLLLRCGDWDVLSPEPVLLVCKTVPKPQKP